MKVNPYDVRAATPVDAPRLVDFVVAHYEEEGTGQPVSRPKIEAMVDRCVNYDAAIAGIVRGPDGGILASIGAMVEQFDWTDESHVMVKWLRTAPEHREVGQATRLMHFARWLHESWSQVAEQPMPLFVPALTTTAHTRKVISLERQARMVCAMYAYGVLPGETFLGLSHVGSAGNGGWGSSTRSTHGRPSAPQRRSA